jgi:hypothetical protein
MVPDGNYGGIEKMRYKWLYILLTLCVSAIMLISNCVAHNGVAWVFQATLSNNMDSTPSEDPENSGNMLIQAVVWEEGVAPNRDIYIKWSAVNGAPGSWFFPVPPATHPAITAADEINPAVAVTREHDINPTETHVVYEINNPNGQNTIWHTWTNNWGITWNTAQVSSKSAAGVDYDAHDPAIVYSEDLNFPGAFFGQIVHIVWSEDNAPGGTGNAYEILYDAYVIYDPGPPPFRGYFSGPLTRLVIRTNPNGANYNCELPEVASVDETVNPGSYSYYFSVVWQEDWPRTGGGTQWHVWYMDGTTLISPGRIWTRNPGSYGQIDPPSINDATEPDIAATQDYLGPTETFFYHIDYQLAGALNSIESHYSGGAVPNPGAATFIQTLTVQGPIAGAAYNKPTIASKLITLNPSVFESWLAWEDGTNAATAPDIYYRMGTYVAGGGWMGWAVAPMLVGYLPINGVEYNPELWNRNNVVFIQPVTHLVFDIDPRPVMTEVEYIDP